MAQWKSEKCDGNSNTMATMPAKRQLVPPEGGYGWFIVLAYAIANVCIGYTYTLHSVFAQRMHRVSASSNGRKF